jgi:hypothetical protein
VGAVSLSSGVWIASGVLTRSSRRISPNSTTVKAGLRGLDFGPSGTSNVGTGTQDVVARRFSPDGDGSRDDLRIRWTNDRAMDAVVARVYRPDGSLVGTRTVPDHAEGTQAWDWSGRVDGGPSRTGAICPSWSAWRRRHHARAARSRPSNGTLRRGRDTVAPTV